MGSARPDESSLRALRPYGIEALLRDDSGNWFSFTQRGGTMAG